MIAPGNSASTFQWDVQKGELRGRQMKPTPDEPIDVNMNNISQISMKTIDVIIIGLIRKDVLITYPDDSALIELPSTRTVPLCAVFTVN
jgi:hypothetical protein